MDKVYDFEDFVKCVQKVGNIKIMEPKDFFTFENRLSQGSSSKNSRPLLASVTVVEFRRGSQKMFFQVKVAVNLKNMC